MHTLYILDPNLRSHVGHYFEYDRSIAEAALERGYNCAVLGHRDFALEEVTSFQVYPVYSADIWKVWSGDSYHTDSNVAAASALFETESRSFFQSHPPKAGDIVFFPTITKAQLPAIGRLAMDLGSRGVNVHIMLRYQYSFYDGAAAAGGLRLIEEAAKIYQIHICTDSHRLARVLSKLTTLPIAVFPIPHTRQLAPEGGLRSEQAPIHFVSLGNARGEKGLGEILAAIRRSVDEPWANIVRFTLQCNDPSEDVARQLEEFRRYTDARVTLVPRVLTTKEYYNLLTDADAVLVPYHQDVYRERTSGVFLEAVAAGKVVLCTADTWMSDLLRVGGGGVTVIDRSSESICLGMERIVSQFTGLRQRARESAAAWTAVHSPANLVAHLEGKPIAPVILPETRRAAVIYPWGDATVGRSGAVVRTRFLVRFLENNGASVRVLFPAESQAAGPVTNRTTAEPYYYMRNRARRLRQALEICARLMAADASRSFHLWYHLWPLIDPLFRARCEELVAWADEVYLEYSFFAPIVAPLCRQYGKRLIVTQHDILSHQSNDTPIIGALTRWAEFSALRRAPRVVVCTAEDRQLCADNQVSAELIPHPVNIVEIGLSKDEANFILGRLLGIPLGRRLCFFIGSSYKPNRDAAEFIRRMAKRLRDDPRASEFVLVVAGACMAPVSDGNFIALGSVEDVILEALYKLADVVLIPLREGTGSSIKSIEALAHGALILTTTIGMRGIPVQPGKHCIIEDDLAALPERLLGIVNDPANANQMRAEAKGLGASYDFRSLFAAYRPFERLGSELSIDEEEHSTKSAFGTLLPRARRLNDPEALAYVLRKMGRTISLQGAGSPTELLRLSEFEVDGASAVSVETAMPAIPIKRSILYRAGKQLLLLIPPVARLYREILLANSYIAAREAELRALDKREQTGVSLDDLWRFIEARNTRLEPDYVPVEARLLEQIADLRELLRETREHNARLAADRTRVETERTAIERRVSALEELLREVRGHNIGNTPES